MKSHFLTTQQAAQRKSVSTSTIKRWVRQTLRTDPKAPIKQEEREQGIPRYLIEGDYLDSHFVPVRKRQSPQASPNEVIQLLQQEIAWLKQQLKIKDKQILQLIQTSEKPN